MTDELREALTDIRGVGDATADAIISVVNDHDAGDPEDAELINEALAYLRQNRTRKARRRLETYLE